LIKQGASIVESFRMDLSFVAKSLHTQNTLSVFDRSGLDSKQCLIKSFQVGRPLFLIPHTQGWVSDVRKVFLTGQCQKLSETEISSGNVGYWSLYGLLKKTTTNSLGMLYTIHVPIMGSLCWFSQPSETRAAFSPSCLLRGNHRPCLVVNQLVPYRLERGSHASKLQ